MIKKNSEVFIQKVKDLNGKSRLKLDYYVIGYLQEDLCLDRPVIVSRTESSKHGLGNKVIGIFTTSPIRYLDIETLDKVYAHTENSVYLVELYNNPNERN